ncbi:actin [Colletotrichum spaethianum]|uniref:Actin n=1 Tax=Colletotrichum spaethianum TaxID=700344 RepID=A0AA37PHJ9_9PEZI|nr:actin [Colletotrichum spaethianum]GKT52284.1 actin [Colletotrichum spaethianum]
MTEPLYASNGQRYQNSKRSPQRQLSHVFESLSAPAYYTTLPALLSTYAANLPTALVIDSGFAGTATVPIYEHTPIRCRARRNEISGQAIDDWLQLALVREAGLEQQSTNVWEDVIRLFKFERCLVAGDFEKELKEWTRREEAGEGETWELPDGRRVRLDRPLGLWAGEVLLNPGILGLDTGGLQHDAFNVVRRCDKALREGLLEGIPCLLVSATD